MQFVCNRAVNVNDRSMQITPTPPIVPQQTAAPSFLKLFYPFHYLVGAAIERALQGEALSHHEAVILWMIHSESGDGTSLPRKEIERLICSWYELGSPAVSKVLKRMATKEKPLITIRDSEQSGREKAVRLTPHGESEVILMMARANQMIDQIIEGWDTEEIRGGLHFLKRVVDRVGEINGSVGAQV